MSMTNLKVSTHGINVCFSLMKCLYPSCTANVWSQKWINGSLCICLFIMNISFNGELLLKHVNVCLLGWHKCSWKRRFLHVINDWLWTWHFHLIVFNFIFVASVQIRFCTFNNLLKNYFISLFVMEMRYHSTQKGK